jgi:hypothetical protein
MLRRHVFMLYTYRSRLNQLPLDLKCELGELVYQKGMLPESRKSKAVELFTKYKVEFIEVGTGTNRFIVKYDDYALKIALDNDGVADNKQEYAMCDILKNGMSYSYEISKGGNLLTAEYCPAMTSYQELYNHRNEIKAILEDWSSRCILGDVGISRINYANWGLRNGVEPVCIDYAYVFPSTTKIFKCICGASDIAHTDETYTVYKCLSCGRIIEDSTLRQRITPEARMRMLANATLGSIEMTEKTKTIEIPDMYIKKPMLSDDPDFV